MDAVGPLVGNYLEHCKNVLRQNGYVVLPKERRVILQTNFLVPTSEVQYSRANAERYADMAQNANVQRLVREAMANGLVLHERRTIDDEVTGREIVFTSVMGVIKPNDDVGNAS